MRLFNVQWSIFINNSLLIISNLLNLFSRWQSIIVVFVNSSISYIFLLWRALLFFLMGFEGKWCWFRLGHLSVLCSIINSEYNDNNKPCWSPIRSIQNTDIHTSEPIPLHWKLCAIYSNRCHSPIFWTPSEQCVMSKVSIRNNKAARLWRRLQWIDAKSHSVAVEFYLTNTKFH